MHIHATHRGKSKNRCMQNASVGCDSDQIRTPDRKGLQEFRRTDLKRLQDGDSGSLSGKFYRWSDELMPSPLRAIRLRNHADYLVIGSKERFERRDGEFRCAHEDNAHVSALALC